MPVQFVGAVGALALEDKECAAKPDTHVQRPAKSADGGRSDGRRRRRGEVFRADCLQIQQRRSSGAVVVAVLDRVGDRRADLEQVLEFRSALDASRCLRSSS